MRTHLGRERLVAAAWGRTHSCASCREGGLIWLASQLLLHALLEHASLRKQCRVVVRGTEQQSETERVTVRGVSPGLPPIGCAVV